MSEVWDEWDCKFSRNQPLSELSATTTPHVVAAETVDVQRSYDQKYFYLFPKYALRGHYPVWQPDLISPAPIQSSSTSGGG